ncbi:NAD-dependent epimerase/dehydratase family protein [Orrella sp. 11846]|uniref:NAD-dependent epimerase/dehydratase family protein n=1 Tax=Orrella sp. 11846 TaxID=3409913 RepID=UPI003B5CF069
MKILVTGATGFVGSRLCETLVASQHDVVAAVRKHSDHLLKGIARQVEVGDLSIHTDWSDALTDVDVVIHCAARAHVLNETDINPLPLYLEANRDGAIALGRQAVKAGVRRLIFISSIKVHGEETQLGHPWTAESPRNTRDPYGLSKALGEEGLEKIAQQSGLELVIIRPPLVYGPGVKANFANLLSWVQRGRLLPLGAIKNNRRSFVALDNLIDLIEHCLTAPEAANQSFLVSDGEDLSTTEFVLRMGQALNCRPRLIPIPAWVFKLATTLLNKPGLYQRLCGSLQLDISHTRQALNWSAPISVDEGLKRTVSHKGDHA